MKRNFYLALLTSVLMTSVLQAQTVLITDFNGVFEDGLYGSWAAPDAIDYGDNSYNVTASGYGSNWMYLGEIDGTGTTHIELDITISGPAEASGQLGPIVSLVDADGTYRNWAWFGQLLGNHILTIPITDFTWQTAAGTVAGLDIATINHLHLQLDPSGFAGTYHLEWNNLNFITVEGDPGDFEGDGDVDGRDFLHWQRDTSVGNLADWQNGYEAPPLVNYTSVPEPTAIGLMMFAGISVYGFVRPPKPRS